MDKSYGSSAPQSISNGGTNRDQFLKQINKVSHKIAKPTRRNTAVFDNRQPPQMQPPPPPPPPPPAAAAPHQPPVYNINMSDFRDVVQKLTGSSAHDRFSSPPPIPPPKQPSSRLQRIRPPPLPQISNRLPPMILPPHPHPTEGGFLTNFRPPQPFSPLPPLPPVYTAAESPISAYIRCFLQDSVSTIDSDPKRLISPKWNTNGPDLPPNAPFVSPPAPVPSPSPPSMVIPPFSPLPFGCLSPVYSPGQLGFPQFPPSFT